ncbi:MAG: MFS transporter [Candidatus Paceibacterota bacterium]|jgi:MFS family permease
MENKKFLKTLYVGSFLFSIGVALTSYINSSFLISKINEDFIGLIYAFIYFLVIIMLTQTPKLLNKFGAYKVMTTFILLSAISLLGLSFFKEWYLAIVLFMIYIALNTFIFFSGDIFIESASKQKTVGTIRGLLLTVTNLGWIFVPLLTGFLADKFGYQGIYLSSAIIMFFLFITYSFRLRNFKDPHYQKISIKNTLKEIFWHQNIYKIFLSYLLLQFFYAWMVLFTPIYLNEYLGFSWENIGLMFTIMLLPFPILQYPLGKLADKKLGEKEMLILGFIIISTSTASIFFLKDLSLIGWAVILLLTRTGAAIIEVMSETYFFKQTKSRDANIISFFRSILPIAYIIAPICATLILQILPFQYLFLILGIIMTLGIYSSATIVDTK